MNNGDESAFSGAVKNQDGTEDFVNGLSKREYFAGQAMQGILSRAGNWNKVEDFGFVAREAVLHADNLLKLLEDK